MGPVGPGLSSANILPACARRERRPPRDADIFEYRGGGMGGGDVRSRDSAEPPAHMAPHVPHTSVRPLSRAERIVLGASRAAGIDWLPHHPAAKPSARPHPPHPPPALVQRKRVYRIPRFSELVRKGDELQVENLVLHPDFSYPPPFAGPCSTALASGRACSPHASTAVGRTSADHANDKRVVSNDSGTVTQKKPANVDDDTLKRMTLKKRVLRQWDADECADLNESRQDADFERNEKRWLQSRRGARAVERVACSGSSSSDPSDAPFDGESESDRVAKKRRVAPSHALPHVKHGAGALVEDARPDTVEKKKSTAHEVVDSEPAVHGTRIDAVMKKEARHTKDALDIENLRSSRKPLDEEVPSGAAGSAMRQPEATTRGKAEGGKSGDGDVNVKIHSSIVGVSEERKRTQVERRFALVKRFELQRIRHGADQKAHVKMNLRGRTKLETWLASATSETIRAVEFLVDMLALDYRLTSLDNDERKSALYQMSNQDLRIVEALMLRTSTRDGTANWNLLFKLQERLSVQPES